MCCEILYWRSLLRSNFIFFCPRIGEPRRRGDLSVTDVLYMYYTYISAQYLYRIVSYKLNATPIVRFCTSPRPFKMAYKHGVYPRLFYIYVQHIAECTEIVFRYCSASVSIPIEAKLVLYAVCVEVLFYNEKKLGYYSLLYERRYTICIL